MVRTVKGRFLDGKIVPLEAVDLRDGDEVSITITEPPQKNHEEALEVLRRTAGAWRGTLDFDAYLKDLYANRRASSREVKL